MDYSKMVSSCWDAMGGY